MGGVAMGKHAGPMSKGVAEIQRLALRRGLAIFPDYGTLLGAARDGKFIPWDSDTDLSGLRCVLWKETNKGRMVVPVTEETWLEEWEGFLRDVDKRGWRFKHKNIDRNVGLRVDNSGTTFKKSRSFVDLFLWHLPEDQTLEEGVWKRHRYAKTDYDHGKGLDFHTRWLGRGTTLPFESETLVVPEDYDSLLTHRYGDWRTPACQKQTVSALREFALKQGMKNWEAAAFAEKEFYKNNDPSML